MQLIHLPTVNSTNIYSKQLIDDAAKSGHPLIELNGTVVYADTQTAGHGRLGRPFYSPSDTGVYMSLIYVPQNAQNQPAAITNPALITATTAVAVCRQLDKVFDVKTQIKWVNDIYLKSKKICGILTEGYVDTVSSSITAAVIGIGINISTKDFPAELSNKAGGIIQDAPIQFDREKLISQIAQDCLLLYDSTQLSHNAFLEYRERSILTGKTVVVHPVIDCAEKDYLATVLDITDEAKLLVELSDGTKQTLDSGEVSLIL